MTKPILIGFKVESMDGKQDIPEQLCSWQIFRDARGATACIMDQDNPREWAMFPVFEGDIEDYDFV